MLAGVASVVVDCEDSPLRLGLAGRLAVLLGASLFRLDELEAGSAAGNAPAIAPGSARSAGSGLAAVARRMTRGRAA
jgi:magnesium chelatase subunit D